MIVHLVSMWLSWWHLSQNHILFQNRIPTQLENEDTFHHQNQRQNWEEKNYQVKKNYNFLAETLEPN